MLAPCGLFDTASLPSFSRWAACGSVQYTVSDVHCAVLSLVISCRCSQIKTAAVVGNGVDVDRCFKFGPWVALMMNFMLMMMAILLIDFFG